MLCVTEMAGLLPLLRAVGVLPFVGKEGVGKWPVLLKKLVEGWLGISRCLKWHGIARDCSAGLDLCLAKSWYPVAVGDFNSSVLVALSDCLGYSFVLPPSFLVPVSALEGHQKLAGRTTMTLPELTLRSAGGGCAGGPWLLH